MSTPSTDTYRFGDLLALARQSWITQMARELETRGYAGYRRSDPAALRMLRRGPASIGRVGDALGVSRQAARKVVDGLEQRGLVSLSRNEVDGRQIDVALTEDGANYASALIAVIEKLNRSVAQRVSADQLAAAHAVLRAVLDDEHTKALAAHLRPPGS